MRGTLCYEVGQLISRNGSTYLNESLVLTLKTNNTADLQTYLGFLCVLDRASSSYLNKGWPTRWHLLYCLLIIMFQTLIRPSSGASEYLLCCVGWLEACWCYVAGFSVGDVVSECSGSAYTRIHHQQTIPLHNTSTHQVSLHNTTSTR